jgi:MFS family permease
MSCHREVGRRALFGLPGAALAYAGTTVGRLSYGMVSLSLLLAARQATHSFASAGAVTAALAVGTLANPLEARWMDRRGPRPALAVLGCGYVAALAGFASAAALGVEALTAYVGLALVAGIAAPPLGPAVRAVWGALCPDEKSRQQALSLDASTQAALFVVGPLVAGVVVGTVGPDAAVVGSAALGLLGTATCLSSPAMGRAAAGRAAAGRVATGRVERPSRAVSSVPPVPPAPNAGAGRPVVGESRRRGYLALAGLVGAVGVAVGGVEVGVAARAVRLGDASAAGYVLAAMSAGSVVGGVGWGRIAPGRASATRFRPLVGLLVVGLVVGAWAPDAVLLGAGLAVAGLALAPIEVVAYVAGGRLASRIGAAETTAWLNTANNLGVAAGSGLAGLVVDHVGKAGVLMGGAIVVALAGVVLRPVPATGPDRLDPDTDRTGRSRPLHS